MIDALSWRSLGTTFPYVIWLAVAVITARTAYGMIVDGVPLDWFLKPLLVSGAWAIVATIRYFTWR